MTATPASARLCMPGAPGEAESTTFDGAAVEIGRGRHVLRIPVGAIHSVELTGNRLVFQLTGRSVSGTDAQAAQRVSYASPVLARELAGAVRAAAAATAPLPNGLDLVTSRTRLGNPFRLWWFRVLFVEAVLGLCLVVSLPLDGDDATGAAALMLLVSSWMGPFAWLVARFVWGHQLRDPWILLRRGVRVEGRVVHHRRRAGDNALYYPLLRFTTREGTEHEVLSCVGRQLDGPPGRIVLRYDPRDPGRRAGRTMTFAHVFWSLVLTGLTLFVIAAAALPPVLLLIVRFGG